MDSYDAGLLNDFGGGDIGWWQDYIRAELNRAEDFYREQYDRLTAQLRETEQTLEDTKRSLAERDAEIEELNELVSRYDGIKDELQTDKAELQQENDALRAEVERLCHDLDYCGTPKEIAEVRKQTAQDCVTIIETKCNQWLEKHRLGTSWQSLAANEIRQRYGLEG